MLNDRPLWVTVPTIGYSPMLIPLINKLGPDKSIDKLLLTVNLEEHVEPIQNAFRLGAPFINVVETWPQGKSLHHGWNTAIELARKHDAWLAVLNDDISLVEDNAISTVAGLLQDNPEYAVLGLNWIDLPEQTPQDAPPIRRVSGTYRKLGVGGFAWVCDPHKVETVPADFEWWYGDDHIVLAAERDGHRVGIASHVHVEHANSLTANSVDTGWVAEAIVRDEKAFRRIWPGK